MEISAATDNIEKFLECWHNRDRVVNFALLLYTIAAFATNCGRMKSTVKPETRVFLVYGNEFEEARYFGKICSVRTKVILVSLEMCSSKRKGSVLWSLQRSFLFLYTKTGIFQEAVLSHFWIWIFRIQNVVKISERSIVRHL